MSLDARRDPEAAQPAEQPQRGAVQAGHQRFVLTDSVAFRYLEEDPSTVVLDRRRVLEGYECYIVEQWACARSHPTFVITTYTGDASHKVVAGVLSVPTDEKSWSLRLRIYFKALSQYHARSRDTPLGTLMITNLSAFPSSLTVIPVPGGDVRKHRESFFVNENLKRLGCSGRVGITLAPPSGATEYKFHQLYRTNGLLCDITEKAVNDWWIEIGNEYYSIEPHDGILGPTTVAALLGTLIGARNRLNAYGAPKTRRLDRKTLGLLHRATAKTASGEMVMDIVGGRDKAGIAEVETVDIERFVQLVHGERSKWLCTTEDRLQYPPDPSPRGSMEISSAAEDAANEKSKKPQAQFTKVLSETPHDSQSNVFASRDSLPAGDEQPELGAILTNEETAMSRTDTAEGSIAGSIYRGIDLDELFEANAQFEAGTLLRRTNSFSNFITRRSYENRSDERWPRRLSLSIAEESLFRWQDVTHDSDDDGADNTDPMKQLACEQLAAEEARLNGERLARLGNVVNAWVGSTINHVQELNVEAERDQQELEEIYYPRLDEYNSLREESQEIITQERVALQESIKDIETLGAKLEYEVNALRGKVEDVEDGVTEFERQVLVVEDMVQMLEDECQPKEGWLGWIYRGLAGRGKKAEVET
ncbi:putative sin3 complex subunit protein [Neofusicoccum parvum UCRNP2]|uniref:Putative sin3 complex subunit protein n=1 Tax=Botryosphaeria parva (strain UCR-NP2) TaxID=1287680 RepID=R1EWS7_BOTPV|nr:putative sin3 complex subunit protein [Neofusicoccum parvum UCRNP2]